MNWFRRALLQDKYRRLRLASTYLLLVMVVGVVLYWRFPNNVVFSNFYGEDGSVYLQNVVHKGWLRGAITPFNGYAIVGLYALCGLGWIINAVFLGGGLLTLPMVFTIVAIGFMAAVIALPYLLFASKFGRARMLLVVAFGAFLPLPMSPHIVIGTVGNQKWIFLYLGFLLVLYRVIHYKKMGLATSLVIDGALLVAAYTNSAVYALVPVALLPYTRAYWSKHKKTGLGAYLKRELGQKDFLSLLALCILLIPQILYVLVKGIPKLPGYLDAPFQPARAIELFINRTYLFGVTHLLNGHMDDVGAVVLFGLLIYFGWKKLAGVERLVFFTGIYAAGVASLLFVLNRTGVTDHFHAYQPGGSGPDQFFYAQTLVMYLPLVLVLFAVSRDFGRWRKLIVGAGAAFVLVSGVISNAFPGATWRNASVFENDAGIFSDQALIACKTPADPLRVTVYPYRGGQFSLYAPLGDICNTELRHYQPSVTDLGLKPHNNDHLPITKAGQFSQTFTAASNGLNGIKIFLSNFGKTYRTGEYTLRLLDASCKTPLRQAVIPEKLMDNAVYNAHFAPIKDSASHTYCFTLQPPTGQFDPIAIQRSASDIYPIGLYTENATPHTKDVVFAPLYSANKNK